MFVLFELFGYILLEYIFTIPGALARWTYLNISGERISLKNCLTKKVYLNYLNSLVMLVLTFVVVNLVK